MSMLLTAAKVYVARIIGGANSNAVLDMAGEAILRTYEDWQSAKFWTFLLKDTSITTPVTATVTKSSATVAAPSVGALDFVNIGQSVTYAGSAGTLAAATVLSFVRGTDGVITSITLSVAFGGGTYTTESGVLTFGADIPLIDGTSDYNLPADFSGSYTARMIDAAGTKSSLKFIEQRYWDKLVSDQTIEGLPEAYTTFNPQSEQTQNYGTSRLRVFKVPDASYTVRLRYFRVFNTTGTYIDVPDQYLYKFLDHARALLLEVKRAQDDPGGYMRSTGASFAQAQTNDEAPNDDDDNDARLKSPYEQGGYRGPIVGNGIFDDL
jgi:hypothetical protein